MEWLTKLLGITGGMPGSGTPGGNQPSAPGGNQPSAPNLFGSLAKILPGGGGPGVPPQPGQQTGGPGGPMNILPPQAQGVMPGAPPQQQQLGLMGGRLGGQGNMAMNQAMNLMQQPQLQPPQWMPMMGR